MKSGTILVIVILTVVITIMTTLRFCGTTNTPNSVEQHVQQKLERQFGSLVQLEWDRRKSGITSVSIDAQCLDSVDTFTLLGQLTTLRKLSVRHGHFKDSDLRPLANLKKLTSVELQSLNFDGSGLAHLTGSRGITTLKLNNNPAWNPDESKWLQELPLLKEIQLAYTNSTDVTLNALANHTELQTLILDHTAVSFMGIKALANNDQLIHLSLRGCELGRQQENALGQLSTQFPLTLDLSRSNISDKSVKSLKSLHIVQLNLSETDITDTGLKYLADHPHCEQLDLSFTACSSDGLSEILGTLPLSELNLQGLELSERVLQTLGNCESLITLSLAETNITDQWLTALQQATALEHLILYNTQLTGNKLESLASLVGLSYLDLSNCPLDSAAIAQLHSLSALSSLGLMGCRLNDEAIKDLADTDITHLNLSNSSLDASNLKVLAAMSDLKEIIVRNCSITRNDFEMFQSRNTNCVIYWQEYGLDSTYAKPEAMKAMTIRQF
ncbi:MAG: hypothetical protein CMJ76_03090 [Planctomycetaceae bacterium]|nr:hypothetical protein [Planctomycetaceae bacterium]